MKTHTTKLTEIFSFELKITLSYLILGLLWILFSDKLLEFFVTDVHLRTEFQTYKGFFFIFVTAAFLYLFAKTHMRSLRLTESKLIESESHYKTLFNNNHSVIVLINPDNARIEDANPAACEYYGCTHEQLCSKSVYDFNMLDEQTVDARLQGVKSEDQGHLFAKHRLTNGDIRDVEIYSNPIKIGNRTFIYSIIHDITEQKKTAEIISKSEERYRNTLDQMMEGCQIIDFNWNYVYLNRTAEKQNRKPNAELIGKRYMDIWPGIENTHVFKKIEEVLIRKRVPVRFENEFQFPDGSKGWFDLSIQPVEEGVFILSIDITERKNKEQQLFESEFRFSKLYENGPFGMALVDAEFRFMKVNPAYTAIMGYSENELQKMSFKHITHPEDVAKDLFNVKKLINKEMSVYKTEKRYIRKDGVEIWASLTVTATYNNEGEFLYNLAVLEDITKSKQAEQELRRSKKLLAETELIGRVGGWEVDINTRMITWTDELYRIHEVDTSFKPNVNTGISFYTPESQPVIEKAVERAIEFGEPFDLELEIITAKGNLRSVHSIGKTDPENNRIYGFFQDITERKRIETAIQQLNSALEQRVLERTHQLEMANKELEAFSYSVSHDLRAPLRHINGYVDLLTAKFSDHLPEKATYYLSVITDSTREMGILIDDLLRFSRTSRQDLHKINFDMNILVNEVVDKVKEDEPLRRIVWSVQNLPEVFGDVAMLKQVWTNLISNAVKYTKYKETAEIKISYVVDKNNYVFSIRDNGVGFDMQYANKLFGVFQRLHSKDEFEGTGIGLAHVQRIIHKHNGKVWAEAEPDKGAVFYFSIRK